MEGHSYILLYLVTITNKKMTVLLPLGYRSNEWQIKLVKKLTKIS